MPLNILAIETSSSYCSVALHADGAVSNRHLAAPQGQGELIYRLLDEILAESQVGLKQIDCIAFGRGPGSFTGLRIAAAVTQALAYSVDCGVIAVSSLQSMTFGFTADHILVAIDARMGEVYWAGFERQQNNYVLLGEERVNKPQEMSLSSKWQQHAWLGLGSGFDLYHQDISAKFGIKKYESSVMPNAVGIAHIAREHYLQGNILDAHQALPTYIRNNVVG